MVDVCNKMYDKEYIYYITSWFPVQGEFMIDYAKLLPCFREYPLIYVRKTGYTLVGIIANLS